MPIRISPYWKELLFASVISLVACRPADYADPESKPWYQPNVKHFPPTTIPENNQATAERIELGKALFFDPVMSRDSSISCASCHKQEFAFGDSKSTSPGIENRAGTRNVPGLFNLAYQERFLREASLPTLEMQVLVPIQEHNEFDYNIVDLAEKLKRIKYYDSLAQLAYGREPDPFVITRSIAAFERSLVSSDSKYDQVKQGLAKYNSLEEQGYSLFRSARLACASCHTEPLFTNQEANNNGLYKIYEDPGRYRFTKVASDSGSFKTPTLRNLSFTAPYMHDGSLKTLDDVIEHYNTGEKKGNYQDVRIKPLNLTPSEKLALKAFLLSLNDYRFIQNPNYRR